MWLFSVAFPLCLIQRNNPEYGRCCIVQSVSRII